MTATQSLKIYEILHRHFKSDADAKIVVQEIETIIDNKFEKEKNQLATKDDIHKVLNEIGLGRQELYKVQAEIEKRFTTTIITIVTTTIAIVGIAVAIIKL